MTTTYNLGHTNLAVSPIGLGCWQFSRSRGLGGSYWPSIPQDNVQEIVRVSLENGINWFDTAEIYGNGASETSLAEALQNLNVPRTQYILADKWFPAFRFAGSIKRSFPDRERALHGIGVDLHQIHQPISFSSVEKQVAAMAELLQRGRIKAVGVSNFNTKRMTKAHRRLEQEGIPLATNQVRYSLLDREAERTGLLDAARELGVTVIAYSPLAQGILTGKYHQDEDIRTKKGPRKWLRRFKQSGLDSTRPLIHQLKAIADGYGSTPAQISLAWVTQRHGDRVVAIPGAGSPAQAESNARAMTIRLSKTELDELSEAGLEAEKRLKKLKP